MDHAGCLREPAAVGNFIDAMGAHIRGGNRNHNNIKKIRRQAQATADIQRVSRLERFR
jgi:hypothetical protein